jgi:hypothetical protein
MVAFSVLEKSGMNDFGRMGIGLEPFQNRFEQFLVLVGYLNEFQSGMVMGAVFFLFTPCHMC